jgi:hypothetical protein
MVTAGAVLSSPAHAADANFGPDDDFAAAIAALRPGDTLRIAPGTYDIGSLGITVASGDRSHRITVTAADPTRPPLLRGALTLRKPNYWRLTYLRIQATDAVQHREALTMKGGEGWEVTNSEFFGAAQSGSFANVAISNFELSDQSSTPKNWLFSNNCVHDAGRGTTPGHNQSTDHNVYVNASGHAPGRITRNVMFNANSGENVKVGNGGDPTLIGASDVRIEYNTLADAGRQVLIFGKVTNTRVWGNLLVHATAGNARVGVYLNTLSLPGSAVVGNNYGYQIDRNLYFPNSATSTFKDAGNNVLAPRGANDPRMTGGGCRGFVPTNSSVLLRYGRTARITN